MIFTDMESRILDCAKSTDGKEKLKKRREAMVMMSAAANSLREAEKKFRNAGVTTPRGRRIVPGVTFTVNQGVVTKGGRTEKLSINVEMRSKNVGQIRHENEYRFFPNAPEVGEVDKKNGWVWSQDSADGEKIHKHFTHLEEKESKAKVQEREIQWQMFRAIENDTNECFKYLQPVAIAGFPCEVPTWVTSKGELGTGNIDALIRRLGGNKGASYLVFELKRPGGDKPEDALQQAIAYAIALSIEANGDEDEANAELCREEYRSLFGGTGKSPLTFGAVAVIAVPQNNRDAAENALEKLWLKISTADKKLTCVNRLGVLLYEWDEINKTAANWSWLAGADPRKNA